MPPPKALCQHRNELADELVDVAIRLSIAAVEMAEAAGTSERSVFLTAKAEMERLRDECESIKTELAHHRLQHGC